MRGHVRKRGQRSWAIVLDVGRDAAGKRRQRWHSVNGTKREAERELARLLNEIRVGSYVEPSRMTLRDYLERWLEDGVKSTVAPKTFERYGEIVRGQIVPALGEIRLDNLQPLDIQSFYSKALRDGRRDGKGGLSPQTVLHCHRVLRAALRQAVRWQLLARDPADAVEPPRPAAKKMRALDEADTVRLLDALQRSVLYPPVLLAATTGLRRGEFLGLRWASVDLDGAVLSVSETLEQTREGLRFKQPKTARGRRTVDLPGLLVDELRRHRREQAELRLLLGPAYQELDLVFPETDGGLWAPDKFSSRFAAWARRNGFAGFRLHDLRHTHASQLLKQGVHPKIVSERLGHATVAFTLDTYAHVLPGLQRDAVAELDKALRLAGMKANEPG